MQRKHIIAVIFMGLVQITSIGSAQETTAAFSDLEARVKQLESKRESKMISPAAEIDFLFEDTFRDSGNQYIYSKENKPVIVDNRLIHKISTKRGAWSWFGLSRSPDITEIEFFQNNKLSLPLAGKLRTHVTGSCTASTGLVSNMTITSVVYLIPVATNAFQLDGELSSTTSAAIAGRISTGLTGTVSMKIAGLEDKPYVMNGTLTTDINASCRQGAFQVASNITGSMDLAAVSDANISVAGDLVSQITSTIKDQLQTKLTGTVSVTTQVVTYTNENTTSIPLEAKLQAVESFLGSNPDSRKSSDLIERIDRAHAKLKNSDWQTDHIRFGIAPLYLSHVDAMATSLSLHAYFAYRRFSPVADFPYEPGRRLSLFIAVGQGTGAKNDAKFESPVYTTGLGFDIVKGVALTAGYSTFTYRNNGKADAERKGSFTAGFTLNSDLWRGLMGVVGK